VTVLNAFLATWSNARQTFGEGTPQPGAQYDDSDTLNQLQSTVQTAAPGSKWTGGAAHWTTFAITSARRCPIAQRNSEIRQARQICLLGVLVPPRRDVVLDGIPRLAESIRRPVQRLREVSLGNPVRQFCGALIQVRPDRSQSPIECESLGTAMRAQHLRLSGRRIDRKPIGPNDRSLAQLLRLARTHAAHHKITIASGYDTSLVPLRGRQRITGAT
jgi:EspA/EspE family